MKNEKTIRYFSMFTGVGGFELGLEKAGSKSGLQEGRNEDTGSSQSLQSRRDKPSYEATTSNTQSLSKVEQDGKGRNGTSNEQGTLLRSGSTTTFSCIGFSEIDKYASELLRKKFPNVKNWGDCTKINPHELPDFDLLCGGFPCQSFSIAGKRGGFSDTRGTMFFEVARILEVKRPKIVFLENVKGLLNHDKGETFRVILQTLDELGYEVQWMVFNSKFFGVPQNRERVFIIGSLRGTSRPEILPSRENSQQHPKQLDLQKEPSKRSIRTLTARGEWGYPHREMRLIATPNIRRLTPTECERLQGFPDGWTEGFSDTQRYKMMGNAVTVNVIKAIGEKLK